MTTDAANVEEGATSAIFALTPSESKRLIARAVVTMPEVKRAFRKGRIIIANGTTNAFVAEELLGITVDKYRYAAGIISRGMLSSTSKEERLRPLVVVDGQVVDVPAAEMIRAFGADDVFIKGGNAVDPSGAVGILLGDEYSGTIGMALPVLVARGSHLIMPVGLEKLVPSVIEAGRHCGQGHFKYHLGMRVGLMPVVTGKVVTEREALEMLAGVKAIHVASGGINGSEGSVVLVVEGQDENVKHALTLVERVKGEPPVRRQG